MMWPQLPPPGLLNVRELDYMRTLHENSMLNELRQGLIKRFANLDAKEPVTESAEKGKEDGMSVPCAGSTR